MIVRFLAENKRIFRTYTELLDVLHAKTQLVKKIIIYPNLQSTWGFKIKMLMASLKDRAAYRGRDKANCGPFILNALRLIPIKEVKKEECY